MGIKVYAMRDERFQPDGVAVYRDQNEIREAIYHMLERHERDDAEIIDALALDFLHACETVVLREFPPGGYFSSRDEFEECIE